MAIHGSGNLEIKKKKKKWYPTTLILTNSWGQPTDYDPAAQITAGIIAR